jgi:hypothetical protein
VPPTDPAAFLGRFARARSTGWFSGFQVGLSFKARGDTDRSYAYWSGMRSVKNSTSSEAAGGSRLLRLTTT